MRSFVKKMIMHPSFKEGAGGAGLFVCGALLASEVSMSALGLVSLAITTVLIVDGLRLIYKSYLGFKSKPLR
jgi:hypothetical protein